MRAEVPARRMGMRARASRSACTKKVAALHSVLVDILGAWWISLLSVCVRARR